MVCGEDLKIFYNKKEANFLLLFYLGPEGFEPTTKGL